MADQRWTGATTTAFATAGNWTSAAPANGDRASVDGTTTVAIVGGDLSAVTVNSFDVMESYEQTIGSSGAKAQINATNLTYRGRGTSAFFDGTFTRVNVNCGLTSAAFNLDGTTTTLVCQGGQTVFDATLTATDTYVNGPTARVTATSGSTMTTLSMSNGYVYKDVASTTVNLRGGFLENNTGNITTLVQSGASKFRFLQGTITTWRFAGGNVDFGKKGYFRVVTNLILENGMLDLSEVGNSLTVTNDIIFAGGQLYDPHGALTRTLS